MRREFCTAGHPSGFNRRTESSHRVWRLILNRAVVESDGLEHGQGWFDGKTTIVSHFISVRRTRRCSSTGSGSRAGDETE